MTWKKSKRKNEAGEKVLRSLAPQERFDDRNEVYHLAKVAEKKSCSVLNQIRDEVNDSLLKMSRIANGDEPPQAWSAEAERLEEAIAQFDKFSSELQAATDQLRKHETYIRG